MSCADCPEIDICNNSCLEAAERDKRTKEEKELYDKLDGYLLRYFILKNPL